MKSDTLAQAEWALEVLLRGSVNERQELRDQLENPQDSSIDKVALTSAVLEQLEGDFCEKVIQSLHADSPKRWTRHWLMTILGRIANGNPKAVELLKGIAIPAAAAVKDVDQEARYWALEALIKMKLENIQTIAAEVIAFDNFPKEPAQPPTSSPSTAEKKVDVKPVVSLAMAVLADANNDPTNETAKGWQKKIESEFDENYGHRRAMRVVPLPDMIQRFCQWVNSEAKKDSDSLADAVQALAVLPPDHVHKDLAVEALKTFIRRARHQSGWNSLHALSLHGLARFRDPEAVPLLIEELAEPHPTILYEAAKALEATVGVRIATDRIVEVASKKTESMIFRYANALRYMDRAEVANQLEHLMFTGELVMQETARNLLGELGGREAMDKLRNRTETMKAHREAIEKTEDDVKRLFDKSLEEARSGYTISTSMNFMLFLVGLAFMGVFLFLLMRDPDLKNDTIGKLIAGGGGAFVLIYNMFFAKTRDQVRESAEHLLGLKVIFLGYLRQLHQTDQAYVRRYLEDKTIATTELKEYADLITATMQTALAEIKGNVKGSSDYNPPAQGGTTGGGPSTV